MNPIGRHEPSDRRQLRHEPGHKLVAAFKGMSIPGRMTGGRNRIRILRDTGRTFKNPFEGLPTEILGQIARSASTSLADTARYRLVNRAFNAAITAQGGYESARKVEKMYLSGLPKECGNREIIGERLEETFYGPHRFNVEMMASSIKYMEGFNQSNFVKLSCVYSGDLINTEPGVITYNRISNSKNFSNFKIIVNNTKKMDSSAYLWLMESARRICSTTMRDKREKAEVIEEINNSISLTEFQKEQMVYTINFDMKRDFYDDKYYVEKMSYY